MNNGDRILGICAGFFLLFIGNNIYSSESPKVTVYFDFTAPVASWVAWPCFFVGIMAIVTNSYGLFMDRKKRLADLARCKARREQEAKAAKAEIVKNEDNQHP